MSSLLSFPWYRPVSPIDRLSLLIVIREKVSNGLLQVLVTNKVIRLEQLTPQHAKPDFQGPEWVSGTN